MLGLKKKVCPKKNFLSEKIFGSKKKLVLQKKGGKNVNVVVTGVKQIQILV